MYIFVQHTFFDLYRWTVLGKTYLYAARTIASVLKLHLICNEMTRAAADVYIIIITT